jgi:hypothetical protein
VKTARVVEHINRTCRPTRPMPTAKVAASETLQNSSDGLDGVATLELDGKWVFGQGDDYLVLIGLQGRLEELAKMS